MQQTCPTSRHRRGHSSCWICLLGQRSEKSGWTFEADLFGTQSIKGFHYSELQRGHSLSLYNGILIHMHLLWQGTKSIIWQACSLLPGINNSPKNWLAVENVCSLLLPSAGHNVTRILKNRIRKGDYCHCGFGCTCLFSSCPDTLLHNTNSSPDRHSCFKSSCCYVFINMQMSVRVQVSLLLQLLGVQSFIKDKEERGSIFFFW